MKYYRQTDGEWVKPVMRGYKMMCCSCSLVHKVDFKIVDGKLKFRATVDNRATAAARRKK